MKSTTSWKWIALFGVTILLLLGAGMAAAAAAPRGAETRQLATAPAVKTTRTPTPAPRTGRITGAAVNVRSQPGLTTAVIGKLRRGDRVQITQQRPGWFEISFPSGSTQRGWVSASLIALDARTSSVAQSGGIPAPSILDYRPPNVLWKWDGENTVKGQDWYFDILLMRAGANRPYDTAQAYAGDAVKKNGVWSFAQPKRVLCDSQLMMAIAVLKDGKWAGWISPFSNPIPVGGSCDGSGSGQGPNPEPTTCDGCG